MIMKHESDFMEGIRKCVYILAGLARQIPSNKYDLVVRYAMVVCVSVFSKEILPSYSLGCEFNFSMCWQSKHGYEFNLLQQTFIITIKISATDLTSQTNSQASIIFQVTSVI